MTEKWCTIKKIYYIMVYILKDLGLSWGGENMRRRDYKTKKKRKWYKILLLILVAIVLIVGGWVGYTWNNAKQTVDKKMHQSVKSIDHNMSRKKAKEREKLNILIMGIDAKSGDKGRSDSLMVMTLRPEADTMQLISIPRDTRTHIVGVG